MPVELDDDVEPELELVAHDELELSELDSIRLRFIVTRTAAVILMRINS